MSNPTAMDRMVAQAVAGRGLWIGLFETGTDLHCTLIHMGKRCKQREVFHALGIAEKLTVDREPLKVWKNGVGRFVGWGAEGDPHVILLQPKDVLPLHLIARTTLLELGIAVREEPYLPHVTLGRVGKLAPLTLTPIDRAPVHFDRVAVVCGDERAEYKFKTAAADGPAAF